MTAVRVRRNGRALFYDDPTGIDLRINGRPDLLNRIMALGPIQCVPIFDGVGATIAKDVSGNGLDGAPTDVTFGALGIGDGRSAGSFNGASSLINIFSPALAAVFNGAELTIQIAIKMSGAGVWTDGTSRWSAVFQADANNYAGLLKHTNNDLFTSWRNSGGVFTQRQDAISSLEWLIYTMTVSESNDRQRLFLNGVQQGADLNGLGAWVGALTLAVIGAVSLAPANVTDGAEQYVTLWDRELTPAEVGSIGVR